MKPWTVEVWRLIAILALSSAMILGAVMVYCVWAFKSNLSAIIDGAPVCLKGAATFDSIAAAQAIGRLDLVSFLLTIAGLLLGVFTLFGFWIIRREAREEARETARETAFSEVKRISQLYGLDENVRRTYNQHSQPPGDRIGLDHPDPSDVPTAGATKEEPGGTT
jgi:hypothetical protein